MFTDKIEADNINIYLSNDKTLSIKGEDSDKIVELMNSIETYQNEVNRQKNIAKHEHDKIINRGYTKQKLADRIVFAYMGLLFPVVCIPTSYMLLVIALIYIVGFKCILNITDKLDKSAREEYDNKVKEYNVNIRKLKFKQFNLKEELDELKRNNIVKEVHTEKISNKEELLKLKQSLIIENDNKEKEYVKR